jgi:hypothetical protein
VIPIALMAAVTVGWIVRQSSLRSIRLMRPVVVGGVALIAGVGLLEAGSDWRAGSLVRPWELFDADRRLAGIFLRQESAPNETIESAFGWPAYESKRPINDASGLNGSTGSAPVYRVEHGSPYDRGNVPPHAPAGMIPLATLNLASSAAPGMSWFVVFGMPDSEIARSGTRALRYRLKELFNETGNPPVDDNTLRLTSDGSAAYLLPETSGPFFVMFTPSSRAGAGALSISVDDVMAWNRAAYDDQRPICVSLSNAAAGGRLVLSARDGPVSLSDVEVAAGSWHVDMTELGEPFATAWRLRGIPGQGPCSPRP